MNILLVDDDRTLADSTAKLIHRLGDHDVYITEDPVEILLLCEAEKVDLVIMDINLPGAQWQGQAVSGADIARMLKERVLTNHIPIILVTAYAMINERQALLEISKADEFVVKPITDYAAFLKLIDQLGN